MTPIGLEMGSVSVTDAYERGFNRLKQFFVPLMLIAIASTAVSLVAAVLARALPGIIGFAVQIVIIAPISFGSVLASLKAARGEEPSLSDLLVPYERCFVQSVVAWFLLSIALTVGFVLFVVPGLFLLIRLSFVPYLVVDENLDAITAFRESWRRTAPFAWQIFGAMMLALPISVVGLLALVVGLLPAGMWISLALATLFLEISEKVGTEDPLRSTPP
ncbi:MAG: hypothetical protein ABGY42_00450 [bacterium]